MFVYVSRSIYIFLIYVKEGEDRHVTLTALSAVSARWRGGLNRYGSKAAPMYPMPQIDRVAALLLDHRQPLVEEEEEVRHHRVGSPLPPKTVKNVCMSK